jgi:hypothetical protein
MTVITGEEHKLIMQFSPPPFYFLLLTSKYVSQNPIFEHSERHTTTTNVESSALVTVTKPFT